MNSLHDRLLLLIAIALSSTPVLLSSSAAADVIFRCAIREGVPTTIAYTPQGDVPVVLWNSPDIAIDADTTQQAECEAGSERFQTYHNNGNLNYITTGRTRGQLVACVAAQIGGGCRGTLFTLTPTRRPRTALQRILRIRLQNESSIIRQSDWRAYVDLLQYLEIESDPPLPNEP